MARKLELAFVVQFDDVTDYRLLALFILLAVVFVFAVVCNYREYKNGASLWYAGLPLSITGLAIALAGIVGWLISYWH